MRSIGLINFVCVLASIVAPALPVRAMAQSVIWSSPWTVQVAPWVMPSGFVATGAPAFVTTAVASDGDVLVGGIAFNLDYRISRITPGGGIRWSVSVPYSFYDWRGIGAMLPTVDGGAFVTVGNPQYDSNTLLMRVSPDGSVLWSSVESAWSLAMPTQQALVTAGYGAVTEFDTVTGAVLWRYANNGVLTSGVSTDELGNVFAAVGNGTGVDAIELDAVGQVRWRVAIDSMTSATDEPVGASVGLAFWNTSTGVLALHTADGSTAWNAAQTTVIAMAGSPAEPIVAGNGVIQRLAAADGHAIWTHPFSGSVSFANFTAGEILVGSGNTLTALNPDTGLALWSATIPAQDADGHSLQMLVAGYDGANDINAFASAGYYAPLFVQPIDPLTGQLQAPLSVSATTTEGVYEMISVQEDSGHIASVALDAAAGISEIRVRRVDSSTGTTLWESTQPLPENYYPSIPTIASGNGTIVAAVDASYGSEFVPPSGGLTWVGSFDSQTGMLRWQRVLQERLPDFMLVQQYTHASAPVVDAAGDIYISYGANISCETWQDPNCEHAQQTLVKLAAADGATLWRFDNTNIYGLWQVFPLDFALSGSDVVINGPFFGALASHDAIDLRGADGLIHWTSDAFGGGGNGQFLVSPDGTLFGIGANQWMKVDPANAGILWSNPRSAPLPCANASVCQTWGAAFTPDGDYIIVGENDFMPSVDVMPGIEGGNESRFRVDPTYTGLRSYFTGIAADPEGNVWVTMHRYFRKGSGGIDVLARLQPSSGTLSSQQVMAGFSESFYTRQSSPFMLNAPKDNRVQVLTYASGPPASTTTGAALLDTTISATGDLSINVTADSPVAHPDDIIHFHLIASYSGTAPIAGVHILADPKGLGLATGLACTTQSTSNCVIGSTLAPITASFDMEPGGSVDISGQITVSKDLGNSLLPALVYGPIGLNESDTLNNFATRSLTDRIFADGF